MGRGAEGRGKGDDEGEKREGEERGEGGRGGKGKRAEENGGKGIKERERKTGGKLDCC